MNTLRTAVLVIGCLAASVLASCTDALIAEKDLQDLTVVLPEDPDEAAIDAWLGQAAAKAGKIVPAGSSIQEALDAAAPGSVILVEPGIYSEALTIDKPNITLMGKGALGSGDAVVIENPGGVANGVTVTSNGDGVRLANFTVRDFGRNGVLVSGVEGFEMVRLVAENNGDYGLFPVRSSGGTMMHCRASGHSDAGLYVGQSTDIRMLHNTVYENVIGIEASNSSGIEIRHNVAEDNTIGILSVLLPPSAFRTVLTASDMLITQNVVRNNNHPNFASPGSFQSVVPAGVGILVVGVDDTIVEKNTVTGHDWVGIGLGSSTTFGLLAGIPDLGLPDPDAEDVTIRKNTVTGNGANPPALPIPLPGVDLLWDGTGSGHCWEKNTYDTSFPPSLPSCTDAS